MKYFGLFSFFRVYNKYKICGTSLFHLMEPGASQILVPQDSGLCQTLPCCVLTGSFLDESKQQYWGPAALEES